MDPVKKIPRTVYASKLHEFADVVFGDESAFERRGRWHEFFRQRIGPAYDGRIVLEIGCFDAAYLARIADEHRHTGFVGLDWKYKPLYEGGQRIKDMGLHNLILLRGRAQDVTQIFGNLEVDEIWLFHPDPCDREAQIKNRLFAEPFLRDVNHVLRDDESVLCLKTDHLGYYQWALAVLGLASKTGPAPFTSKKAGKKAPTRHLKPEIEADDARGAAATLFNVTMNSSDFWHDSKAMAHTTPRAFANHVTLFESRFVKKRLPIYFIELRKRALS